MSVAIIRCPLSKGQMPSRLSLLWCLHPVKPGRRLRVPLEVLSAIRLNRAASVTARR